jgi:hypothetical protein
MSLMRTRVHASTFTNTAIMPKAHIAQFAIMNTPVAAAFLCADGAALVAL